MVQKTKIVAVLRERNEKMNLVADSILKSIFYPVMNSLAKGRVDLSDPLNETTSSEMFSDEDTNIYVLLDYLPTTCYPAIRNTGPSLPSDVQFQVFESIYELFDEVSKTNTYMYSNILSIDSAWDFYTWPKKLEKDGSSLPVCLDKLVFIQNELYESFPTVRATSIILLACDKFTVLEDNLNIPFNRTLALLEHRTVNHYLYLQYVVEAHETARLV